MKDENIKEILDNVKKCCEIMKDENFVVYQKQDIIKLLDYITNLQQEIEKLNNDKRGMLVQLYKANDEKDNYKSKCENAIEYIKTKEVDFVDVHYQQQDDYFNGLLNILQGSDK